MIPIQKELSRLDDKIENYEQVVTKFKDLSSLIGILLFLTSELLETEIDSDLLDELVQDAKSFDAELKEYAIHGLMYTSTHSEL